MRLLAVAIVCLTWCAVGFVMAFRPQLYRKWAENSWTGRHAPRMTERWLQQQWSSRIIGILFMAFGVCSFIGFVLLMR
jgi:ammonia channel protein AmtB